MINSPPPVLDLGLDVDRGGKVAAAYIVGCAISFIFVALRFWARIQIRGLALDDWCMLVTWVLFIPLTVLTCQLAFNGGTRHLPYLAAKDPIKLAYLVKTNWIAQPFGIVCLGLGKVAVSLLIVRLLDRVAYWRKWFLYGLSIWTILNTILMIVLTFAQCKNPKALWQPELKATTTCWDPSVQSNFSIYGSSAFTFVDFVLAFMPITLIWKLQLDVKKKIGLAFLLGCGVLTGVCAAIKTSKLASLASRSDLTWETYNLYIWTGVEIVLLIVCGSVPTLKPLYYLALGKKQSTSTIKSYGRSTVSAVQISSKENYQGELGVSAIQTSSRAIAVTKTFETSSRCSSEESMLQPKPRQAL